MYQVGDKFVKVSTLEIYTIDKVLAVHNTNRYRLIPKLHINKPWWSWEETLYLNGFRNIDTKLGELLWIGGSTKESL